MIVAINIGGTNTKIVVFDQLKNKLSKKIIPNEISGNLELFMTQQLPKVLNKVFLEISKNDKIDSILVTMTSPIVFPSFDVGVNRVLDSIESALGEVCDSINVFNSDGEFFSLDVARNNTSKVNCIEYIATCFLARKVMKLDKFVMVDVGSTSVSVIPFENKVVNLTRDNELFNRLQTGEGGWLGVIRAPVAAIAQSVSFRGNELALNIMTELLICDILFLLNKLPYDFYSKYRSYEKKDILERVANLVLVDVQSVQEKELVDIAREIYCKYILKLVQQINKVTGPKCVGTLVFTGSGAGVIKEDLAKQLSFDKYLILPEELNDVAPLVGMIYLAREKTLE